MSCVNARTDNRETRRIQRHRSSYRRTRNHANFSCAGRARESFSARVDLDNFELRADVGSVARVAYATTLMNRGVWISTVEHLLSALYGMGIDNALRRTR